METLTTDASRLSALAGELLAKGTEFGLSLIVAMLLLIAGYAVSGWAARTVKTRLEEAKRFDETLIPVLAQVVRYVILAFTLVLVLAQFGVQTASLIAVIGAAGLAIGLALQGTLQNVAAGLMLLILRPFQVGDWIEAAGKSGTAEQIGLFMTRLKDFEGLFVAIPNSKIWADTIVNHSRNPHRRLVLDTGISYSDDIDRAREVLQEMVEADKRILRRPDPPMVLVSGYGDSAIILQIRAWTRNDAYWPVRFDLTRAIKYALDEARITIPFPHRQVIISADGQNAIRLAESGAAQPEPRQAEPKQPEAKGKASNAEPAKAAAAAKRGRTRRKPATTGTR